MAGTDMPEFYLTASEAYPALERAFLEARSEVIASFRVFDPKTRLRSEAGRAIGETWGDLVRHVVSKGVRVTLRISDFDPIVGTDLHRATHVSVKGFRDAVGDSDLFDIKSEMHPAQMGMLPRLLLWPRTYLEVRRHAARLRELPEGQCEIEMEHLPALRPLLKRTNSQLQARIFPPPNSFPATHHQKLAVFDGVRLYVGGLDVDERRFDTLDHDQASEQTWHDVQVMVGGARAKSAHTYLKAFVTRDQSVLKKPFPDLLRTYSMPRQISTPFLSPRTVLNEIETAHEKGFRDAKRLIYLETQFFRDTKLAKILCNAGRANPDLGVILVLPAAPDDVAFEQSKGSDARYGEYLQAKCLDQLHDAFGHRLFVVAVAQTRPTSDTTRAALNDAPLVYVHAKVSIFDEAFAIVSSANLNGRSMRWDTEVGVSFDEKSDVLRLKERCFEHWLRKEATEKFFDPATAVSAWRDLALANQRSAPSSRVSFILPYAVAPARQFGRNLPGVAEEIV
ncbi:phospholipase D-like domain-containing protein [Litoreibacter halocynthiae]|uniref:phospholipase D-like domain-containing protein n=1 Tax=Litoreibacter halocynthiae TaxID=1242689 RepID=UPI0024933A95|nr:phospholipase D-like domain-containing protein [Litoreibacter halocynthiae]